MLYYVSNLDGVFGWAFPETDFAGYQKIHFSVYPTTSFAFEVYPVIPGEPRKASEPMVANQWNDIVLDFTEYETFKMKQLGFVNKANTAFFLDNVYFFKEDDTTAIDNLEKSIQVTKLIENGQLIIIRDGKRYTITGVRVK